MGLPREERQEPAVLLKLIRDEYDRLQEISPLLPPEIVKEFQTKFKEETDISKPEETNGLEQITIYPSGITKDVTSTNLTLRVKEGETTGLPSV